ncbi:MAG: helix-turn-helix transcriptional regulator [Treponema sp.]|uniref:helix-turn-helix domain-containing protein n=1 Tax=Treponema sp. TaxID=166 RepID=UPI0025ECC40D|nr:helix-turn-helix transcriptional regulator [Treponema sp.]MBQ8678689.1 helix-turn-helix transcriptional regulator [Treponema sp.]
MKGYQEEFIYNLKKYRKERKLTQAQLSELCDVANGTIANIECGLSKPSFDLILTIATVLGVHPALLFSSNPIQSDVSKEIQQHELLLEMYNKLQGYFGK